MVEVELKFTIAANDHDRLRRAAALRGVRPSRRLIETFYFDTPARELAARGMALRLRRVGSRWIEGLKAGESGTGGLHRRREWEHTRRDAGVDLWRYAQTPLAEVEDATGLHERLAATFRVVMTRIAWRLSPRPGTRLEVALDHGWVAAAGRREAISEVEIECLQGAPAAAFDLAARLLDEVCLRPSAVSKAQRGYRLLRAEGLQPARARRVDLTRAVSPAEAARKVVAAGLEQLQANEEGLFATTDPEFVHQARIALRRLRAALRMFRDAIGEERARAWREALGNVARALGAARDWDVLASETLPPILAAYGDPVLAARIEGRVGRRRNRERRVARKALHTASYGRVILDISRWLAEPVPAEDGPRDLRRFAVRILGKRHRRLVRDAADPRSLTPEARHRLRIAAKRLRYGTDALASLLPRKRADGYVATLSILQDALGKANDVRTALRLLEGLAPPPFVEYARSCLAPQGNVDAGLLRGLVAALGGGGLWRR